TIVLPRFDPSAIAGVLLVAGAYHVAIRWVDLDCHTTAAEPLARDQGRPGSGEWVEDKVAAAAAVLQHRLDQRDRLHRRVVLASRGPVDMEDGRLRVAAIPAAAAMTAAAGASRAGLPAVENVLMLVLIVGVPQHGTVFH